MEHQLKANLMRFPLLVEKSTLIAEGILSLELVHPAHEVLPSWEPGAHIEVSLPSGRRRQYSLCGEPCDRTSYKIAIGLDQNGKGGSVEIHQTVLEGKQLEIREPRNNFQLHPAAEYLFVAGGIGITPIVPMIHAVAQAQKPWRLYYGGRSLASMAFCEELRALGSNVVIWPQDENGLMDIEGVVAAHASGSSEASVYCCGPEGLLRAALESCETLQTRQPLHFERFSSDLALLSQQPTARTPTTTAETSQDTDFEVELYRSGTVLKVPAERSLLDVVREAAPDIPYSCEEGHCGTCETTVIDGTPAHNDIFLTDEEKASGKTMMICVGRSKTPRLVLDI